MYFDNGAVKCEVCSNSCYTCLGSKDFCTECMVTNTFRIDKS